MILSGELLLGQRLELADGVDRHLDGVGDAAAEVVVDEQQVPGHALLDEPFALAESAGEVEDQVVALPLLHGLPAVRGLLVVVATRDEGASQTTADHPEETSRG